ncbi:MAG: hypothetical protein U0992_19305 [Planctomycetaceae bacterium]
MIDCPAFVLVRKATVVPESGRYRVEGVLFVEAGGNSAVAVFTNRELAVRFARENGAPDAQVGSFEDPIDFGYFLQEQRQAGFTHVCIDPLGMLPPLIPIGDALTSLADRSV